MNKAMSERQGLLFQPLVDTGDWKPSEELPDLSRHKNIWLDMESTGKRKHKDLPCGIAIATAEGASYLPTGHLEGGNLDEEKVRRWAKAELRNKRIGNLNTGFDAEILLNWGVDLEAQGCTLHDVAHAAALLNENRYGGFNLNDLGLEYTGQTKVDTGIRPADFHRVHSSLVGSYAENDAIVARNIDLAQQPLLEADDLCRVMDLEDRLIWANNHMERSGMRLDMPKLDQWRLEMNEEYSTLVMRVWMETGVKLHPNIVGDWGRLFDKRGLKRNETGEVKFPKGRPLCEAYNVESYTEEVLHNIKDEFVQAGLRMRRLSSLRSKYIDKYWKAQIEGVLHYSLYQLRAGEDDFGTVVGRYSSANVNIQQVFKPTNQYGKFCDCGCIRSLQEDAKNHKANCLGIHYGIRELMIPDDGFDMCAVDGSQLQFRLFAHYSNDPDLIAAYQRDLHLKPGEKPIDFHQLVAIMFELERQAAKHSNFAMILGMGRQTLADRCGLSCTCQSPSYWARQASGAKRDKSHIFGVNSNHSSACPARKSNDNGDKYEEKFPAAKALMTQISELAEHRGYIKTLLGRRRRYKEGDKFYSAFAGLLQGSEADVVKSKIITLYNERKTVGIHKLRAPVHDEVVLDIEKSELARSRFAEVCKIQEVPLKVPLIWSAGFGKNWAQCH